jgi:nicotinate-nucleotide pyrophosphorylase (carboxylating)
VRLDPEAVRRIVQAALSEDLGKGDVTTDATVPVDAVGRGALLAKQGLMLAGLEVARETFTALDPALAWEPVAREGEHVAAGAVLARAVGRARGLLTAERVALNFLQRLSGVATLTAMFVEATRGTRARIRDTRKTTPLLRFLEKYAVELGGGVAHRPGLDRGVLVKENHIRLAGSVGEATRRACGVAGGLEVEVEVERLDQIAEALEAGADMLLLDNFEVEQVRSAVSLIGGRVPIEVSGGIRLDTVRAYAETGVDLIAVGALTHSAPAVDISLETEPA